MKKLRLLKLIFVLILAQSGYSATEYWFAVPYSDPTFRDNFRIAIQNHNNSNTVSVEFFTSGISNSGLSGTYNLDAYEFYSHNFSQTRTNNTCSNGTSVSGIRVRPNQISNYPPGQTGLVKISGTYGFDCYFECRNGGNAAIFNLKADAALGTDFIVPVNNQFNSSGNFCPPNRKSFFIGNPHPNSINVTITANSASINHYLAGTGTPTAFTSQSFTIPGYGTIGFDGNANNISGTIISASEEVTVSISEDLLGVSVGGNAGADWAGDQLIANHALGKEYICISGEGPTTEFAYIYATLNNTNIKVKECGSTLINQTINAQNFVVVDLNNRDAIHIESDKPVSVYQTSGGDIEIGSSVIPPLGCRGSNQVICQRGSGTNDQLIVSLLSKEGFENDFKFSRMVSGTWEEFNPSETWTDICKTCGSSPDNYVHSRIDIPTSQLAPNQLLKVEGSNVFQMGVNMNNSGATWNFGYFSSFEIYEPSICIKQDTFCPCEDLRFWACDSVTLSDFDVQIDSAGTIITPRPIKFRNFTGNNFDIRDTFENLLPLCTDITGCYTLLVRVYNISRNCNSTETCNYNDFEFPFCIAEEGDSFDLYDTSYFCDFSDELFINTTQGVDYTTCESGFIRYINDLTNQVMQIAPLNRTKFYDSGSYIIECYDTTNCNTYFTHFDVVAHKPDQLEEFDTLLICDWTQEPLAPSQCAELEPCGEGFLGMVHHDGIITPLPTENAPNPFSGNPLCLDTGDYIFVCYDTLNCSVNQRHIRVDYNSPDTIISYDTFVICDFSGTWYSSPPDCYSYTSCDLGMIIDLGLMIEYPMGPSPDNQICLQVGDYLEECYDTINCIVNLRYIHIEAGDPVNITVYDTITYCNWSGQFFPGGSTCAQYEYCPNSVFGLFDNGSSIILNESYVPDCLEDGDYIFECYDTLNCAIVTTYLHVLANTPTTINHYDTLTFCDWSSTSFSGETCVSIEECTGMVLGQFYNSTEAFLTIPDCLEEDDYVMICFDTLNCEKHITYIHVSGQQPSTIINHDTIYYCKWPEFTCAENNCAEYEVCSGSEFSFFDNGSIVITNEAAVPGCLPEGNYFIECFDTVNCVITHTYLTVIGYGIDTITQDTLINYCGWNNPICGNYNTAVYQGCDEELSCFESMVNILDQSTVLPDENGTYYLEEGNYIHYCFDSTRCTIIQTSITVNNTIDTLYDSDTLELCGITEFGFYTPCLGEDSDCSFIFDIDNSEYIISIPETTLNLSEGSYEVFCFNETQCEVTITSLEVLRVPFDTITSYDTLEYCENATCAPFVQCTEFTSRSDNFVEDLGASTTIQNSNGIYCLTEGEYIAYCIDSIDCKVYQKYIHVDLIGVDTNYCEIEIQDTCQPNLWPLENFVPPEGECSDCHETAENADFVDATLLQEYDTFYMYEIVYEDTNDCSICTYTTKVSKRCFMRFFNAYVSPQGGGVFTFNVSAESNVTMTQVNYQLNQISPPPSTLGNAFYNISGTSIPSYTTPSLSMGDYHLDVTICTFGCSGECCFQYRIHFMVDPEGNVVILSTTLINAADGGDPPFATIPREDDTENVLHPSLENTKTVVVDINKNSDYVVVPNPTADIVKIFLVGNLEEATIVDLNILSTDGSSIRKVENYVLGSDLDLRNLSSGLYYIEVYHKDKKSIISVIRL